MRLWNSVYARVVTHDGYLQSTLKQISGQIICCRWPALDAKIKDPPAGGMLRNQRHWRQMAQWNQFPSSELGIIWVYLIRTRSTILIVVYRETKDAVTLKVNWFVGAVIARQVALARGFPNPGWLRPFPPRLRSSTSHRPRCRTTVSWRGSSCRNYRTRSRLSIKSIKSIKSIQWIQSHGIPWNPMESHRRLEWNEFMSIHVPILSQGTLPSSMILWHSTRSLGNSSVVSSWLL